ncbi:MAG: aldo/keto reductase, partial [Candidatus Aquilonibacter sp.]
MQHKLFGATGVLLPVIGQGTWDMPESGARKAEAIRAMRRGIELGMTHLDTAEMYGSGAVERILGEAIAGIARESLFVASKVLPSNASYKGTIEACERSLKNLRLEYLDLYMLHWPSSVPLH